MSVDVTLNLILGLAVVASLVGARFTAAVRGSIKAKLGAGALVWLGFTGLTNAALWTVLAFKTDRWQFAAIALIPFLINYATSLAQPKSVSA